MSRKRPLPRMRNFPSRLDRAGCTKWTTMSAVMDTNVSHVLVMKMQGASLDDTQRLLRAALLNE